MDVKWKKYLFSILRCFWKENKQTKSEQVPLKEAAAWLHTPYFGKVNLFRKQTRLQHKQNSQQTPFTNFTNRKQNI